MKRTMILVVLGLALLLLISFEQSSAGPEALLIRWWTFTGGGSRVTGSNLSLQASIGQPFTGSQDSGILHLCSGFQCTTGEPLDQITVSGPLSARVNQTVTFTLLADPSSCALPIRYTIQATDLSEVAGEGGLVFSFQLTWKGAGKKSVKVTADNGLGPVSVEYEIVIEKQLHKLNLPLTFKE
jgi:hypothetical protein